ncbi:MAG TPA: 3-hydroxyacyl-[acyl-carrier-protein] dehydratase FabZ [Actinobacteria bacterium]|nr:3-hydroxyacyl-[acyl-carrier-protein] dehydratase FabZ [Actinomycetota bacterium]
MKVLNKEDIKEIIPHREPFLFIDQINEVIPGQYVSATKKVNGDEYYFKGHFPGNPVMPGVVLIETMAQAGAVSLLLMEEYKGKLVLFAGIEKARFKRIVKPGDILEIKLNITSMRRNVGKAEAMAAVEGEMACSAELLFFIT